MLKTTIPADFTRIAEFHQATAEDTASDLLMQEVMNGWPESKKDCHPISTRILDLLRGNPHSKWSTLQGTSTHHPTKTSQQSSSNHS